MEVLQCTPSVNQAVSGGVMGQAAACTGSKRKKRQVSPLSFIKMQPAAALPPVILRRKRQTTSSLGGKLDAVAAVMSSNRESSVADVSQIYPASMCIDGIDNGFNDGISGDMNLCHSLAEIAPWLALDFGSPVTVGKVVLVNRINCCGERLRNAEVRVSDELPLSGTEMFTGGELLGSFAGPGQAGEVVELVSSSILVARYVIVQMYHGQEGANSLNLAEVTVWQGMKACCI